TSEEAPAGHWDWPVLRLLGHPRSLFREVSRRRRASPRVGSPPVGVPEGLGDRNAPGPPLRGARGAQAVNELLEERRPTMLRICILLVSLLALSVPGLA